jgi:hypothetical protein
MAYLWWAQANLAICNVLYKPNVQRKDFDNRMSIGCGDRGDLGMTPVRNNKTKMTEQPALRAVKIRWENLDPISSLDF